MLYDCVTLHTKPVGRFPVGHLYRSPELQNKAKKKRKKEEKTQQSEDSLHNHVIGYSVHQL